MFAFYFDLKFDLKSGVEYLIGLGARELCIRLPPHLFTLTNHEKGSYKTLLFNKRTKRQFRNLKGRPMLKKVYANREKKKNALSICMHYFFSLS